MEETSLGDFVEEADSGAEPDGDAGGRTDAGVGEVGLDAEASPDAEGDTDADASEDAGVAAEDGGADRDSSAAVEPARPTSVWTPDGGRCERCGDRGRRRWRAGGALVCGGCADW